MASSSVSQDDIDNDFEKNSRRSRIRTARARAHLRLESGGDRTGCAANNSIGAAGAEFPPLENVNLDRSGGDSLYELAESVSSVIGLSTTSEHYDGIDSRTINQFHSSNAGVTGEIGVHSSKNTGLLQLRGTGSNIDRDSSGVQRNASTTDRIASSDRSGAQAVFIPSIGSSGIGGIPEGHETSPKPGVIRTGKDKSSVRNKLHHVNKGKPQRDRRKLREKRRSSGVVHLASTESTGGSTTGDDEGSSDACIAHMEDRHIPNQLQPNSISCTAAAYGGGSHSNFTNYHLPLNSSIATGDIRKTIQDHNISLSHSPDNTMNLGEDSQQLHNATACGRQSKSATSLGHMTDTGAMANLSNQFTDSASNSLFYDEMVMKGISQNRKPNGSITISNTTGVSLRGSSNCRRDKSPSDLEADDENDHDSLNQSETGSGSNVSVCNVGLPSSGSATMAGLGSCTSSLLAHSADSKPKASYSPRNIPDTVSEDTAFPTNNSSPHLSEIVEENKRLLSLMEEKDRRIHLLEYKVQQLMRDTLTISEEQSRLQKENSTLLRALSKLTMGKEKHKT